MDFVQGQTYHRPTDDPAWCVRALDEIARTFPHPTRVSLGTSDGETVTGTLTNVEGGQVTVDMPRESLSLAVAGNKIDSFRLLPSPPPEASDETRPMPGD